MEDDAAGAAGGNGAAPGGRGSSAKRGRNTGVTEMVPWGQPPAPGQSQPQQGTASRICRVKATGGKDRHSKVYTSKGVRDRRVRLSVPTAIQFYDLQDRLGFDQPSKAVEWLINAASAAIDDLPPLDPAAFAAAMPPDAHQQQPAGPRAGKQQQQQGSSRSWCSSTSETSKGSDLSLSRSDCRYSRDKEVTVASAAPAQAQAAASFTELLTGDHGQPTWQQQQHQAVPAHSGKAGAQVVPTYPGFRFGNAPPVGMVPAQPFNFNFATSAQAHFSLVQDALAPAPAAAGDYSLDFSMSSGFPGANNNRGALQSNSQPHFSSHHQQQQLQDLADGPSPPFLYDENAAHPASDNSHHLTATAALQLWNGFRHSSAMKEKTKN